MTKRKKKESGGETTFENLWRRLLDNRVIAVIGVIGAVVLVVLSFAERLSNPLDKVREWMWKAEVVFSTPHEPLRDRGRVSIRKDSKTAHVVGFNTPISVAHGSYDAAAHIDNRVLLEQPFEVQDKRHEVVFRTRFTVKGVVSDGRGRPLRRVVVRISGHEDKTKHDGVFILDDLPMQREYEIDAYPEAGSPRFNAAHPWTGTVYNGSWETTVTRNIVLVPTQ